MHTHQDNRVFLSLSVPAKCPAKCTTLCNSATTHRTLTTDTCLVSPQFGRSVHMLSFPVRCVLAKIIAFQCRRLHLAAVLPAQCAAATPYPDSSATTHRTDPNCIFAASPQSALSSRAVRFPNPLDLAEKSPPSCRSTHFPAPLLKAELLADRLQR